MRRVIGLLALILASGTALAQAVVPPPAGMSASQTRARISAGMARSDPQEVAAAAELLARMGGSLTQESQDRIAAFVSPEQAAALKRNFAANAQPIETSGLFAQVPVEYRIVEGMAHDPKTGRMFIGTVVDGKLLVASGLGWREVLLPQGLGGLFGMRIDPDRRRLWVANGVADPVKDRSSIAPGLLEIDLDTLKLIDWKGMPAGAEGSPGDVALGPDGTAYVSDGLRGGIYQCRPGCTALETLVAPGTFKSPQGMVVSRDGNDLIVADYSGGLARVTLGDGKVNWLEVREAAMLDGIDGLMRHGDALVAIQNGTNPRRIIRIILNEDETRVDAVDVIERANPAWGEPTLGTISEDKLVYVADSQWEVYGVGGVLNPGKPPRATALRAVPLPAL
ncbi:hypothetical protein [Sphingobium nicotianae]|uniref:SMP-30/Gluconolactonase/LRE-like region domain-containing protein n=1 Tax=Sphingobium nicotianae TaxID=2782607 RepID=A0A9X1D9A4_9SPHN|nr:hypothetical protein [Sphingobium nicotianae]MBT2185478.1 hypothetical protein [Sphingobium nicotianae]